MITISNAIEQVKKSRHQPGPSVVISSQDAVIIPVELSSLYIVGRYPSQKTHLHSRSSFRCYLKPFF